jgi:hypothetical protein
MKKLALWASVVSTLALASAGCFRQSPVETTQGAQEVFSVTDMNGQSGTCAELLAGQTIPAGHVCFNVIDDFTMEVTFTTTGGWELEEAHLWVGCDPEGYPQTRKGNPIPGQFPYATGDIAGATTYTFVVDLTQLDCLGTLNCDPGNLLFAMAHAAVRLPDGSGGYQTETGWGDGSQVPGKNWATQMVLTLRDDSCDGTPERCFDGQVAFAFGGPDATCFLSVDEDGDGSGDFDRWGWTNLIGPGSYSWPIFADAISCDRSRGQKVGTVTVEYDGSTAVVTYTMDPAVERTIASTHLYVGSEVLPRDELGELTVAPRLYPLSDDFVNCSDATGTQSDPFLCDGAGVTTHTYTVTGLSGSVHVIAHAGVLGEIPCP